MGCWYEGMLGLWDKGMLGFGEEWTKIVFVGGLAELVL
jgi:hypothetical protein